MLYTCHLIIPIIPISRMKGQPAGDRDAETHPSEGTGVSVALPAETWRNCVWRLARVGGEAHVASAPGGSRLCPSHYLSPFSPFL